MRKTADILFDVASQTLLVRALEGRPTSGTFEAFDDEAADDGTVEFSGAVTLDTVDTTVTAASGAGQADPQKITLASTAGIETERKYLLAENAVRQWVEPIEVAAGYIRVRYPLANAYTTDATLVSTYVLVPIDDAWAADEANLSDLANPNPDYRVALELLIDDATCRYYDFFDLVRTTVLHQVDIADINARAPGLVDSLPTEYQVDDGRPLLEAAWQAVRAEFRSGDLAAHAMRHHEALDELVVRMALVILAEGGWAPDGIDKPDYITLTQRNFDRHWERHFAVALKPAVATGTGGGADVGARPTPYWSK